MKFKGTSLISGLLTILGLVAVYGAYKMTQIVNLLMIGATAQVALSGNIPIPALLNNTTTDIVTSVDTGYSAFNTAELVVIGLVSLVVIITVFWPIISGWLPKSSKKGGMN